MSSALLCAGPSYVWSSPIVWYSHPRIRKELGSVGKMKSLNLIVNTLNISTRCRLRGSAHILIASMIVLAVPGCGKHELLDLTATVYLDGQPLEGACVTLVRPGSGTTDSEGIATFTTFVSDDGVLPGSYKAIVIKSPQSAEEEFATYDRNNPEDLERILARERSGNVAYTPTVIPRVYLSPDTTPLSCEVSEEKTEALFELNSSYGKK